MFKSFIKGVTSDKDDKEKRKRDKKDRKDKQKVDRGTLSAEELLRLEVRRSIKLRGRRKDKEKLPSGITADYTADFLASLERTDLSASAIPGSPVQSNNCESAYTQSDSSETSLNSLNQKNLPPLPPKPPKRGILKTPRVTLTQDSNSQSSVNGHNGHDVSDHVNLVRNTLQNELMTYQNVPGQNGFNAKSMSSQLLVITSTSPSADSLTDTTNSSFATPPFSLSPVGESQGFHRWSRTSNFDEINLPLPEIVPLILPKPRTLVVQRQKPPRSDFGFSLRRAMVLERTSNSALEGGVSMRAVIFAEPGAMIQHHNETGLLPGDKLLEVNGIAVKDKTREEIIDMIKASGDSVTLKVQPVAELSELSRRSAYDGGEVDLDDANIRGGTLKRSGSRRFNKSTTAKSEEHLEKEKQWLDAERIWLMHRGGFAAAKKEEGSNSEPGKITIRLEQSGDVLVVDEDDIEKANPPQFDRAEDLAALRHLNESSILHTLRQRYATNLIHTYAGSGTLLVVNPMAPLAIYSEKIVALFKGCKSEDMPPHIYSLAQSAYHNMLSSRRDQSLVFLGRSGSGKTSNFRHCVQYLVTAAGTVNNVLNLEKLTAMWTVLESFGNCKTVMNTNATRFTQIFSVDFDQSGVVSSASIQILLLEKSRIAKKLEGETTFHVMHRLLCGVEGTLRKELFLDSLSGNEHNALMHLMQKHEDKQRAHQEFIKTCHALNALGVTEGEQKVIFSVLAAIFHLGCAGAVKAGNNNRYQFSNPQSAQRAASLLGTTAEELSRVIFGLSSGGMVTPNQPRAPFRTPSPTDKGLEREAVGIEAVEGLVMGLYSEVFNCVANLINRAISANTHTTTSILLVDAPGFQNPATCGRQTGASFDDLCHNYLQERFQLLFHHTNLVAPKDRYLQENIDFTYDENENENLINPLPLVNLLDKTAQNTVIRTSQTDLHEADRRGLLWLLDEESIYPGGSDDSFVDRLFTHYGDRDHQLLLRKAPGNNQFILQHLQGTNPVLYSAKGWLKQSRENPVSRAAVTLLQESCKEDVSKLFVAIRGLGASSFSGSVVGLDGSQSLRRASSIRRTFTGGTAAMKKKSVCLQTKFTIDGLIETLRRTKLRFVQCLLPQHNAGLCESNSSLISLKSAAGSSDDGLLNVPLLRSQIRGAQILDAVRLYKQGYPTFLPLGEFRRKFGILAGESKVSSPVLDERKAVEDMLSVMDLELSSYRVGLSQIFFRTGVVSQLESQRDERLAGVVISLQAHCRGYLARRKLQQRKLQDLAVRCIQRNVRKFMVVRDWPWWRLLVRVTPLLNVHRTEEELRAKTEELETLKIKLQKIEAERTSLKNDNDKLEAKFNPPINNNKMPLIQSNYTPTTSPPSLYGTPSSSLHDYSPYPSNGLPPANPNHHRRYTPVRTAGLDVPSERKPVAFQPRPLKSLALVSESPRISITRSPSPGMRRVYPQSYESRDCEDDMTTKDESPVVFDANLTFVLGTKSKLRQNLKPIPAHLERETASNALSCKISSFLQRTDHVMDEWKRLGRKEDEQHSLRMQKSGGKFMGRSRSATNIMIKGFQYYSRANSVSRSSVARELSEECNTDAEIDELSEMTADLAEEHSTATLAAERLDAETSERLRLEKELSETKHKNKELQQSSERLEMELLYARSDMNGICEEDEDGSEADGVYKQRYERALKELEFTKRRLQQQHEDDLEQLIGLKKQLEKKLADAYEEVEEQRQVVGTWKRKVQKLTGEMNDLKLLLEEQSSRNNLLEKKQRKYDSEASMLHDELKKEKQAKERLAREKEVLVAEKYSMDSTLADLRLELELKEEKLAALQREFDEITCGGKTEEEVTVLRKQKIDCERRLQDQEEELDELAGQVQLLEQAKLRLEMTLESMRKECKKEAQIRDEELEEARCNAQKKVKALEQQLENEHEERTILLREKHELERRLQAAADAERHDRAGEEALLQRLKRDLKRTKALLRDTQAQLERQRAETPGKNMIRQLRNQLEDLECARAIALKAKQSLEQELSEMQSLLEDSHKQKADAEDKANALLREKSDIQTQLEENEEELAEVLKKYKAAVQQMSVDQMTLQEQVSLVSELEVERNHLKEQLAELTSRLESAESMGGASSNLLYKRSELKVKELESKLELEQTTRSRLEVQIARLKETVEKLQSDVAASKVKEQQAQEQVRKLQRQLREIKEELNKSLAKESEVIIKKKELEKRCEALEAECSTTRTDLRIALKRIEDLQSAIQGELEDSISNDSDSEEDSFGSDESVNTFLTNHKLASPVKNEKSSISNDIRRLSSTSRSSTSSNLGKDSSYA